MSAPPDQKAARAAIRKLARDAGLVVTIRVADTPIGKRRRKHEGSVFLRPDGKLWVGRVMWHGRTHQVSSVDRDQCLADLEALKRYLAMRGPEAPPLATEVDAQGRAYVKTTSASFRKWIYDRDQGRCRICHRPVGFDEFHVDHIRPRSEGGTDAVSNYRITHVECNHRRGYERRRRLYV